ncbi:hypothetical protein WICMUC_003089 [Wickerhamomyces mucosus]|uniref:WW domain-containing protein n=1 Tax=Wickerhamomyces mucosus TaxID=1378264 RepID=A0A9P8TCR8_9ASCO|nr:hypothetical protein WICMUC_003089 [Wickerhamomyces mucosus]
MSSNNNNSNKNLNQPIVPNGWKAVFDEQYQTWFYVDLNNGNKSQWDPPKGTNFPNHDDNSSSQPPSYKDVEKQSSSRDQQNSSTSNQRNYNQQQYPQQQQYYPQQQQYPQQQYYQQQPQYYQQQPQYYQQQSSGNRRNYGGMAMGAGAGLLGGMLLGEMLTPHHDIINMQGPPPPGDFGGGGFGGGDFGGGDFGGGDF